MQRPVIDIYTCRFVSTVRKALTHMNAHINAHVHTTTHTCTCNTQICMYIYATHTHMHTQHHVQTGWILYSLYCKPARSWQDCGDAPSGWGYSRLAKQGGKLFFCHLCCAMHIIHCTLSTTNIQGNLKFRKHIQQITAADKHWRIKSFVH